MPKIIDLTGKQFGQLTVLKEAGRDKWGNKLYICKCSCGSEKAIKGRLLITGKTKSCGCLGKAFGGLTRISSKTFRLHKVWWGMQERCYNREHISYKYYGSRGIGICTTWRDDFTTFYLWAVTNGYKPGLQIDRINNDGDYHPGNCKFSTRAEQAKNRQNTILVEHKGRKITLAELAKITGKSYETMRQRYHKKLI